MRRITRTAAMLTAIGVAGALAPVHASAISNYDANQKAVQYARQDFGTTWIYPDGCSGPYSSIPGQTQWFCTGQFLSASGFKHYQIYIGPGGAQLLYASW